MSKNHTIEFKHAGKTCDNVIDADLKQLDSGSTDGLNWTWSIYKTYSPSGKSRSLGECVYFTWKFEWDQQAVTSIVGFNGFITSTYYDGQGYVNVLSKVDLTASGQVIQQRIGTVYTTLQMDRYSYTTTPAKLSFEFSLTRVFALKTTNVVTFSNVSDRILKVDEVEMHVNKAFLSMHSEYFRTLFDSELDEKSISQIPIDDVSREDLTFLLKVLHLHIDFPRDYDRLEKLLKLADRLQIPSLVHRVEHHLMNVSELPFTKILMLVDKFCMESAVMECMSLIKTRYELKHVKTSQIFPNLSIPTKLKLLDVAKQCIR